MDETRTPYADIAPRQVGTEYYAYHGPEGATRLGTTVVHGLADVMGEDITDTGFILYDSIDPDALDRTRVRGQRLLFTVRERPSSHHRSGH